MNIDKKRDEVDLSLNNTNLSPVDIEDTKELNILLSKYYITKDQTIDQFLDERIKNLCWKLGIIPPWWEVW